MAGSALDDAAEHLSVVSEVFEVRCGVEGWFDSVGYSIPANFG